MKVAWNENFDDQVSIGFAAESDDTGEDSDSDPFTRSNEEISRKPESGKVQLPVVDVAFVL